MRTLICTSNSVRHKFVANTIGAAANETLIISECRKHDTAEIENLDTTTPLAAQNFKDRYETELKFFEGHDSFRYPTVPVLTKEASLPAVADIVRRYKPEAVFVFGASILKESIMSLFPLNKTVNMHLGLSPYYRGSGTNFWPFVNNELQYVGATLLHLDPGIDKGDIIAHIRPEIEANDTLHIIGNKVIREGTLALVKLLKLMEEGKELPRTPQWPVEDGRYYETKHVTEEIMAQYLKNMKKGMVSNYVKNPKPEIRTVPLP